MNKLLEKTKYKNHKESAMIQSQALYYFKGMLIKVVNYNKEYFEDSAHLLKAYQPVFSNYFHISEIEIMSFIDFLEMSVEEWDELNGIFKESDFSIENKHILFQDIDGTETDFINMGQFLFKNYEVYTHGPYMFIEDLETTVKYLYYGNYED